MHGRVRGASLEDTLADVLDRAGEAFGIQPGPDAFPNKRRPGLAAMLVYIGFYRPAHGRGFDAEEMYGWENRLPVVDMNGNVTYRPCQEATYRQLIVSERLGLIDGDVTRPYICPSMPQGEFGTATEVVRVAADAARAAYAALEGTRDVIDDAGRVTLLYALWQGVKKTFKKPRKKKRKKEGKTVRSRRAKGRRKSGESGTH